jgi:hypothetical protein
MPEFEGWQHMECAGGAGRYRVWAGWAARQSDGRVGETPPTVSREGSPTPRALNSAVECHLHTVEVIGSNPVAPTMSKVPWMSNLEQDS